MKLEYFNNFSKNTQIENFMKIRPVGAELFHMDRETDRHKKVIFVGAFAILRKHLKIHRVVDYIE